LSENIYSMQERALLAMDVNDHASNQLFRGAGGVFASELAATGTVFIFLPVSGQ
jgi:hypothetical protein